MSSKQSYVNTVNSNTQFYNASAKNISDMSQATVKASPANLEMLKTFQAELTKYHQRITAVYDSLLTVYTEQADIEATEKKLDAQLDSYASYVHAILKLSGKWTDALAKAQMVVPTAGTPPTTQKLQFKVQSALKPDTLTPAATPVELPGKLQFISRKQRTPY